MKITIQVKDGLIQGICATQDCEICVIDYDLLDHGECPVREPVHPDVITDDLSNLFADDDEVYQELKRYKF